MNETKNKRIMLIDDRTERQKKFYEETDINLDDEKYSDVLDNFTAHSYEELLEEFRNNDFRKLDKYEVIITHRSAFGDLNGQVISSLKDICKQKKKSLVFFSGGISSINFKSLPFEHLLLNSKKFYSQNLILFLNMSLKEKPNLLILAFGENWKVNLLLNSLEKINLELGKNIEKEKLRWDGFKVTTKLELISNFIEIKEPELVDNFVSMQDFKKLTKDLTNKIKQQVVLNV